MYDITIFKMVIVFKISKDIKIHTYIEQHSRQQWNLSFSVVHPIYSSPGYNPLPREICIYYSIQYIHLLVIILYLDIYMYSIY